MVGEVADGGTVGGGLIVGHQSGVLQGIGHLGGEGAGEALLHVLAVVGEADPIGHLVSLPYPGGEAGGAAVEMVISVVDSQGVFYTVQGEAAGGNAVGIAAHGGAQVFILALIGIQSIIAQGHIHHLTLLVRNIQGDEGSTVGEEGAGELAVVQGDDLHGLAIPGLSKGFALHNEDLLF